MDLNGIIAGPTVLPDSPAPIVGPVLDNAKVAGWGLTKVRDGSLLGRVCYLWFLARKRGARANAEVHQHPNVQPEGM